MTGGNGCPRLRRRPTHRGRTFGVLVALLVVAGAGCGGTDDRAADGRDGVAKTRPPSTETSAPGAETTAPPPEATESPLDFGGLETVASGLEVPWGIAFVDEDTILVTERPGRVRVVDAGALRPAPAAVIDVRDEEEGGLLGIAVAPTFSQDRYAYVYYTTDGGNRVSRFPVDDGLVFGAEELLLDGIPSARFHDGGGLAFGPDGMLYVATGDARQPGTAADPTSLAGKILRVAPDGSVPADNPTAGSPVFSYGHRNPQGLAWDASAALLVSEHGPTGEFGLCCNDELNVVRAGGFYGWPYLAADVTAAGGAPPAEPLPPLVSSGPETTWAPAGVAVRSTSGGSTVFVANLAGAQVLAFPVVSEDPVALGPAEVVVDGLGRMRAAALGPDDCLFLGTSNTDGRGAPVVGGDVLLRACPSGAADP